MSDDWEDWENEDFVIPVLSVPNDEQLKRLEERKLIEESDNKLTNALFSNDNYEDLTLKEFEQINKTILPINKKKELKKNIPSKQKENEQKQKELSKKIKEDKIKKLKERELFGEAEEDDEYAKYEDMFY